MSLPDICTYCGVPNSIDINAGVPQRNETLVAWVAISRPQIREVCLLLGMDMTLFEPMYQWLLANIIFVINHETNDFETFRTDLMEIIALSYHTAHDVYEDLTITRGHELTQDEKQEIKTECVSIAGMA